MSRHWRPARRSRSPRLQNAIWLIGLGVLFWTHAWWPGILIVIGLSLAVGALERERAPEPEPPPPPVFEPPPPRFEPQAPRPVDPPRPLPDICPNCGAPPRSLPQREANPMVCPYCGSDLSGWLK